jgi:hypothetical protein
MLLKKYLNQNFLADACPGRTKTLGNVIFATAQNKGYHMGLFPYDTVDESVDTVEFFCKYCILAGWISRMLNETVDTLVCLSV